MDKAIAIEHIGSTSIKGLPAKPIIDIAVAVNDLNEADSIVEPLQSIGYNYVPKADLPSRRFIRKGEWQRGTHHLHVYEINSDEWNNNLLFRDYLKGHPETLLQYSELKKRLAALHPDDRTSYARLKAPFIESVIHLAQKKWMIATQ